MIYQSFYPHYDIRTQFMPPNPTNLVTDLQQYTIPQNLPNALELIEKAVSGEREDELFYSYLINIAPTDEAKKIIMGIREDEMKHNRLFRTIYYQLTNKIIPPSKEENFIQPTSYCDSIAKALQGELGAVQRYRKILFALQNRVQINILIEIITDELRHANLYNYLFSIGKCYEGRYY